MNTRTGLIVATALASLFFLGTADAQPKHKRDGGHRHQVERHGYVHAPVRARHMPRWLRHDRQFRRWYRHSSIRHNPYLPWWKVYRVYERQTAPRRHQYYERHVYHDGYGYVRDHRWSR
jgi:hypothetical protein